MIDILEDRLEVALEAWESRSDLYDEHNLEYLCFEIAKITDSIRIIPVERDTNITAWIYVISDLIALKCVVTDSEEGWYVEADIDDVPEDFEDYDILTVGSDVWTKTYSWLLSTLDLFENDYIQEIKDEVDNIDAWSSWLDEVVKQIFPGVLKAYKTIKGFDPILIDLSVGFSNAIPPEDKIAVYQKYEGIDDVAGVISIQTKTLEDQKYLQIVLTHELIHYVLDTNIEHEPHEGEFCVMADLLGIPRKHQQ